MRTHKDIIAAIGNDHLVADTCNASIHTVRSWKQRNSIPAEHWNLLCRHGWTTLEELASGAELKAPRHPFGCDDSAGITAI